MTQHPFPSKEGSNPSDNHRSRSESLEYLIKALLNLL